MLTDLSFLNKGEQFPPKSEMERMNRYAQNKMLFEGEQAEIYAEQFRRIERVISNFREVVSYPVILNYLKLVSLKIADLLLGEQPLIKSGDSEGKEQQSVYNIIGKTELFNTAYQTVLDVSRYGDGLFIIYNTANGGMIDVTQPNMWYPIVDQDNIKQIKQHVLAWKYNVGDKMFLKCHIHEKGFYEERIYALDKSMIGTYTIGNLVSSNIVPTGLSDFAVVQISNVLTSDRIFGIDDYVDLDSIISEIMVRVGQISRVLDKHANPSVSGPNTALTKDPATGEYKLKMGNFFGRDSKEDPSVEYITWDGQLDANFRQIELLINQLAIVSEMGVAIFASSLDKIGNIPSGTALRRMFISALAKVNRIKMRFDTALKKAIKLCSELGGEGIVNLIDSDISITWQDGLPNDPVEEANIMSIRTAGKATMSTKRAIMQYDGMDNEEVEGEIALIEEEEVKVNPFSTPSFVDTASKLEE